MRRRAVVAVAAALAGALLPTAHAALVAPVAPASQPNQANSGPGSDGPCQFEQKTFDNAKHAGNPVYVFQPKGPGAPPVTGGRCSDPKRPVVFIAHGLNSGDPTSYEGLIDHLVTVGNIVVFPTYQVNDGNKSTLEDAYRTMDDGNVQAVAITPRADTTRVGWWGHSMGGSMIPFLVRQGAARGWGTRGIWMNNVAMTFALLVGGGDIQVPPNTRVLTVGFEDDELADNRIGDEVFDALTVPLAQKQHVSVNSDAHGQPAFVADHFAPAGGTGGGIDAVDYLLWRYHDLLETCALSGGRACDVDYSATGTWSDGTPVTRATVTEHPVDVGPYPALLAECDGVYGQQLNQDRIHRCGPTHIGAGV